MIPPAVDDLTSLNNNDLHYGLLTEARSRLLCMPILRYRMALKHYQEEQRHMRENYQADQAVQESPKVVEMRQT